MSENNNENPQFHIALVLDDVVVDVLHADVRLTNIILSGPTIVNATGDNGEQLAFVGDRYDSNNGTFSRDGVVPETDSTEELLNKVAFVINNEVVDVLFTNERLAAILLSDPIIVNVTNENGEQTVDFNYVYNPETQQFSRPLDGTVSQEEIDAQMNKIKEELDGLTGWIYDEERGHKIPPVPYPQDGEVYTWDNDSSSWIQATEEQKALYFQDPLANITE